MPHSCQTQLIATQQRWQLLLHPLLQHKHIQLWISHLDTSLPEVSGNKCLKLKYHLQHVFAERKAGILTFGGAFSNHLCAVAAACQQLGLQSSAYVRTDKLDSTNPTLAFCLRMGMQLHTLDRTTYRQRSDPDFISQLQAEHPTLLIVPEGGSSEAGAKGMAELDLENTPDGKADLIISAAASGGTLAGIIQRHNCPVLGIAVVKDLSLPTRVKQLLTTDSTNKNWQINMAFTGKGYGQFDSNLLQFCRNLAQHQLYVEPVYTGKALAGIFSLINTGVIASGTKLSFFHTGGLQGLKGLFYRELITANDLAVLSGNQYSANSMQ